MNERSEQASDGVFRRYLIITLIATPLNLVLYALILSVTTWTATSANVAAAVLVVTPTFFANREWVWRSNGGDVRRQMALYLAFTVVNVTLATLAAGIAERSGAPDAALVITTFAVYAAIWGARYFFLDALFTKRLGGAV